MIAAMDPIVSNSPAQPKTDQSATDRRLLSKVADVPDGFQEDDELRSAFVRRLTLHQIASDLVERNSKVAAITFKIPLTLIRYWHDVHEVPDDVRDCLESWEGLRDDGFEILTFNDKSAAAYISARLGARERSAFDRCRHPAMRSDYFRMCYVLADGGFYVDADDVMTSGSWRTLYTDDRLKAAAVVLRRPKRRDGAVIADLADGPADGKPHLLREQ